MALILEERRDQEAAEKEKSAQQLAMLEQPILAEEEAEVALLMLNLVDQVLS